VAVPVIFCNSQKKVIFNHTVKLNHTSANGGFPVTISMTVQPNDQISACSKHSYRYWHVTQAKWLQLLYKLFHA